MNTDTSLLNTAIAPPLSMGLTYIAAGQSVGMLMENAVFNEKLAQITANTSVNQCCALMVASGVIGISKGK
ncbi:RebB family R body protein [Paraferrimonas sp. SM1919]|uniref:RebB family R body protein n=1 Tax=Paraferrimonas sp. SM1919 TaxID=2662263 RepID=UPI0013CFA4E1|nr:RebB family R body protein [Paraferrimonas sp. SM1919]